ncbi:unnamed protein product [Orchesella dallaii]|uniref:C2H2-type domain-containing protein n=1 Tax=Orchesella dallaii TaxID=48710 RepID=A0ABP1SAW2_9HEXA
MTEMGTPATSRCLLCRSGAVTRKSHFNLKSCATSLCTIFGLPDNHPFKTLYEKSHYCDECMKDVHEADVSLAKLELLKQSLLRFQSRVYNKLGDNYFQIIDSNSINVSCEDFEHGGDKLRGRKFKYDEIVKIVYEKLDKECPRWERFSSEGNGSLDENKSNSVDASVQTDHDTNDLLQWQNQNAQPTSILPDNPDDDVPSAWNNDDDDPGGADDTHDDPLDAHSMISICNSTTTNAQGQGSHPDQILVTTINFDQKVYCTFDPENCNKFFYDDYNLEIHIKSFHLGNPKPYECNECRKSFVDEARLKYHSLRVHTPFGPYICEHCGRGFGSQPLLRDHNRKMHEKDEIFNCYFCSAPFPCKEALLSHEDQHRSNENPFECLFCFEKFPNSSVLKSHFANVHAEGKLRCEICDKILANENGLRLHMITHSGIYKCDVCSFTGSSQSALNTHMSTHSTDKPYTCELCGQAYKYSKNLVAHRRIHTGEKPYMCKICNQTFRERAYLKRHEESHSQHESYECSICTKRFKVKENLRKHLRVHNGYTKTPKLAKSSKQRKPRSAKASTKTEGDDSVEGVKKKSGKKHRDKSLKTKGDKTKKKTKKEKKRDKSEESPAELEQESMETQKVELAYPVVRQEEITQIEIDNAISSIQPHQVVVTTSDGIPQTVAYTNATVYTTNHFEPATTINVPHLGPVTVITTTQSDPRVIRNPQQQQQQQVQYEFGYLG